MGEITSRLPSRGSSKLFTRLLFTSAALAATCAFAPGNGAATAFASTPAAKVSSYGSFMLTGPVSGKLVPLASSCDASTSAADVTFGWYGHVATLKGVSAQSIVSIELDLQGSKYGQPGALKNTGGNPPFLTFGATTKSGLPVSWQSRSGHYSTTNKGVSGTVDVLLEQADGQPGSLVLKGSWQHCRLGGNL